MVIKGPVKYPFGNGNVLYFDCIQVNTPVVMLYYDFVRCYHRGETG